MLKDTMHNAEQKLDQPVTLEQLIGKGQDLPSLPEIYLRVSEQLENENSSVQQIGDTVQNDPAITTRVLKMVNSAFYGLPNQVSSIAQAVSLLGRERLKHILIGSVLRGVFSGSDNPAFSMQVFWQHSIKTAIIARQLAQQTRQIDEPEAMFTAGLLHDIGKLLLINRFPERMLAAEEYMIHKRVDILSAELRQVGLSHTAVGEALMQHWGLPQMLVDCAGMHHETVHDGPHRHATHLIYLANCLSQYVPPLDHDETQTILDDIENWDMGALSLDQIASACQHADDMVFEVMESLGMVTLEISAD
ncbi:MAG: HDOD domain-containing protein [Gammaproteobacteria bacterium]|nr:HDOD domain-containing protein [Gammaproteobacteria bacterium]